MLFNEIYNEYFNTLAAVIDRALEGPVTQSDLIRIAQENAFRESFREIKQKTQDGKWPILCDDGSTIIRHKPTMPLTTLQKQWINAIANDPRIRLFADKITIFPDVEPLFQQDDYYVFDKYLDGDDYSNSEYIERFRTILGALHKKQHLLVDIRIRTGEIKRSCIQPKHIEYSEKEDKFRLICSGGKFGNTINISRILHCEIFEKSTRFESSEKSQKTNLRKVELSVIDQNNALERVLIHFSHYKKEALRMGDERYLIRIYYDKEDETELLVRVLSFGAAIKVVSPDRFVNQIKERLIRQRTLINRFLKHDDGDEIIAKRE